MISFLKKKN